MTQQVNKDSIFCKFSLNKIIVVCSLFILSDIWRLYYLMSKGVSQTKPFLLHTLFIVIFLGILFILNALVKPRIKEEKMAIGLLGFSISLDASLYLFNRISIVSILIITFLHAWVALMFWLAYKEYQSQGILFQLQKTKSFSRIFVLIFILLIFAILAWILASETNRYFGVAHI